MIPAAFAPLASHLWQSTLFTVVAGVMTLVLRCNQARVRYWLWLAASYKFLLPFSWLVGIGHQFEWRAAPAVMPPVLSAVTDMVNGPIFLTSLPTSKPTPDHLAALLLMLWAVWAFGFVAVAGGWVYEWLRVRAIVRGASPLPLLGLPIRVVSTPARLEPGIFGIFRPVLLLPEGIAVRLTQAQLQAVVTHELCHVRRRDNLAATVHMMVEALFWFHALVWWLGARIVDEREALAKLNGQANEITGTLCQNVRVNGNFDTVTAERGGFDFWNSGKCFRIRIASTARP
jgi:bla regulator protein BlaR1